MTLPRRTVTALLASAPVLAAGLLTSAWAQPRRDSAVLGIALEPPGLDPTVTPAGAIGAIAEIVHGNILEGLTRITMDGAVMPLLAETWSHTPDGKTYTFTLRKGLSFSDGAPFDADAVKSSFERAKAPGSTNKAHRTWFDSLSSVTVADPYTVILVLDHADATLPFRLGESAAVILHPNSAAGTAGRPVGTGPFMLERWDKGVSVTLVKWDGHRNAAAVKLRRVTFRFIADPAAQTAALLAGDIDAMPRFGGLQALAQFKADKRFTVQVGSTSGKGLLAINHRRKPFDDLRVRRALSHAVDRKAFIQGAQQGLGWPIGSHFAPSNVGYVDLSRRYPHDPDKARALLREAGVTTPLNVTLTLPPPLYARQGGEIIAAQLARIGVIAKLEHVDWPQWLAGPFKGDFDLTLINHPEPMDYAAAYADPDNYFGYDSPKFRAYVATLDATSDPAGKARLWSAIQRQLADDAVNVFLWNPAQVVVARRGLRGLWHSSPIPANDLAALAWAAPAGT